MTTMNPLTDDNIAAACKTHGAKTVSDAGYSRMSGNRHALPALGLADAATLGEAHRVTVVAHRLMSTEEQALDLAQASIDLAKVVTPPKA
jgi:hypothetical protein